jgi:hypothetical protein
MSQESTPSLALVIIEAERQLITWTRDHHLAVLRLFSDGRALGAADRQLASTVLILMRSGEDMLDPIVDAYAITGAFEQTTGTELPGEYPGVAARAGYLTARLEPAPASPVWEVVVQDVRERQDELRASTPRDLPPAVWIAAAVQRQKQDVPDV